MKGATGSDLSGKPAAVSVPARDFAFSRALRLVRPAEALHQSGQLVEQDGQEDRDHGDGPDHAVVEIAAGLVEQVAEPACRWPAIRRSSRRAARAAPPAGWRRRDRAAQAGSETSRSSLPASRAIGARHVERGARHQREALRQRHEGRKEGHRDGDPRGSPTMPRPSISTSSGVSATSGMVCVTSATGMQRADDGRHRSRQQRPARRRRRDRQPCRPA